MSDFGEAPETTEHYLQWYREVAVGAAYLERCGVKDFAVHNGSVSPQQEEQRTRVLDAMVRARALRLEDDSNAFSTDEPLNGESFDQTLDFVIDR